MILMGRILDFVAQAVLLQCHGYHQTQGYTLIGEFETTSATVQLVMILASHPSDLSSSPSGGIYFTNWAMILMGEC